MRSVIDRILAAVEAAAGEMVGVTSELIRVPTVNPPGEWYEACHRQPYTFAHETASHIESADEVDGGGAAIGPARRLT